MFTKFEFIASLVDRGDEITFTYDEKKPKKPNKDSLEDIDFGSKANPLLEKRQYKTKYGFKDKTYGAKPAKSLNDVEYEFKKKGYGGAKKDFGSEKKDSSYTPAYKRDKFKGSGPAKTTNKKGNSGLGYKAVRKK